MVSAQLYASPVVQRAGLLEHYRVLQSAQPYWHVNRMQLQIHKLAW